MRETANSEKSINRPAQRLFECGICFESYPQNNAITYGCSHAFCAECVSAGLTTSIEGGLIENMSCPETECTVLASEPMIRKLVSQEIYLRYQNLQIKQGVSQMDDVVNIGIEFNFLHKLNHLNAR